MKHRTILIIVNLLSFSFNIILPVNAEKIILPPVINGYKTEAGTVFAP